MVLPSDASSQRRVPECEQAEAWHRKDLEISVTLSIVSKILVKLTETGRCYCDDGVKASQCSEVD